MYAEASHEDKLVADVAVLGDSLERATASVAALDAEKAEVDVYDLRHRIDHELRDDLALFAESRESIAYRYGLAAYG